LFDFDSVKAGVVLQSQPVTLAMSCHCCTSFAPAPFIKTVGAK